MNQSFRVMLFILGMAIALASTATTHAQNRFPFSRPKPDEQTPVLTDKAGPWLIMVTSFSGEGAEQQAMRLANELKTKHHLKTYTYTRDFEFNAADRAVGHKAIALSDGQNTTIPSSMTMTSLSPSSFKETAVLVGDFSALDDPHAQRALERVKSLKPETLSNIEFGEVAENDNLAGGRLYAWRMFSNAQYTNTDQPIPALALKSAFLLANPMLPEEYFQARKLDKTIIDLNEDREYGLFNNPGAYSVRVATFSGAMIVDQNEIAKIKVEEERKRRNREGITDSKLANAMKKATVLTRELRRLGYEAYEFHDRYESYVCVGSFDVLSTEDERGNKRMNPAIEEIILKFKAKQVQNVGGMLQSQTFPLPTKFAEAGIACDVQPLPVLVPKKEEARTAAGRFLQRFK